MDKILLIMRGAPGCGKTTFIKEYGLDIYTLSPDALRLMFQNPVRTENGRMGISQENENLVWGILNRMLNKRMKRGDFTVIDATNSRGSDIRRYKSKAEAYGYDEVYCIDFFDTPIEVCKERNRQREAFRYVPEYRIEEMYENYKNASVPSGITVIKSQEAYTGRMEEIIRDLVDRGTGKMGTREAEYDLEK